MTDHQNQPLSTADIARGTSPSKTPDGMQGQPADRQAAETSAPAESVRTTEPQKPIPTPGPTGEPRRSSDDQASAPLFASNDAEGFRSRWTDIQAGFVDDPRQSVEQADGLVAEVIKNLADAFAKERTGLEERWQQGSDPSTEDLRVALRRYRSFFDRLLSV